MIAKLRDTGFLFAFLAFVMVGAGFYFTPVIADQATAMADGGGQGDSGTGEDGSPDDVASGEGICFVNTCVDPWEELPD